MPGTYLIVLKVEITRICFMEVIAITGLERYRFSFVLFCFNCGSARDVTPVNGIQPRAT